ncbi:DUF1799 domain-containing protein [Vreelandella titanicae]|uniref:DUF1799 domain-containing protein n=1 Tax=Vreelandella titanicae TaxID=664683 RepID=UPI00241E1DE5|nr:DUF1799 domain-containing protein [Halomonas titanicae]
MDAGTAGRARGHRKKLKDLARQWARGRGKASNTKNELADDAAAWGFKLPKRYTQPQSQQSTVIWPCNAEAFEVFCDCGGQWRYLTQFGAKPQPKGIERTALASSMEMLGVKDRRATLHKIQVMEGAALAVMRG